MKYDFIVQPGSDPSLIQIRYAGSRDVGLTTVGGVLVKCPLGELTVAAPQSFQYGKLNDSKFRLTWQLPAGAYVVSLSDGKGYISLWGVNQ